MPISLNLERELQRALEVIERQSRVIESLTALLGQEDDDATPPDDSGYLNHRV